MYLAFASNEEEPGRISHDFAISGKLPSHGEDLLYSKWARRGWTFQEEAMAGACALFGMNGMYFGSHSTYRSMLDATSFNTVFSAPSLQGSSVKPCKVETARLAWQNLTIRYSRHMESSFTRPEDLLPALSGLARTFGNTMGTTYIAGHWLDSDLSYSLAWTQDIDTLTLQSKSSRP